ncbi:TetR family transcriptional regulator [Alkalibaculum sp. M08DMB]|uniref:TetR family transcriptional regulator n=2 Tax=Alkalibaculum sporogenes TaxID=2655001 RepID=A0A6A7KBY4_9FIRM|nr:TetR family transcriptional regulator [Alkalibaculum sporogenes]
MEKKLCDKLLFDALSSLLQFNTIDKLTVSDIIKEAGVSRSTFYRYYCDKHDLLNSNYEKILENTLYRFKEGVKWEDAVYSIYHVIKINLKLFQNAFKSSDVNSLKNYIFNMSRTFHLEILEKNGVNIREWKNIKVLESYIYGNLEIMQIWILEGMDESIEDMMEVFDRGIPSEFIKYFKPSS